MKKYNNLELLLKMVKLQKQLKKDISKYIDIEKKKRSIVLYQVPPRDIICYREKKL